MELGAGEGIAVSSCLFLLLDISPSTIAETIPALFSPPAVLVVLILLAIMIMLF